MDTRTERGDRRVLEGGGGEVVGRREGGLPLEEANERVVDKWRRRIGWRKSNEVANYHSAGGVEGSNRDRTGNNLIPMSNGGGGGNGTGLDALHCPEPVVLSLADSVCR